MRAVIGLGNYPKQYRDHRHNIGYKVVELFVKQNNGKWKKPVFKPFLEARIGFEGRQDISPAVFFLPQTYMNNSGRIVPYVFKKASLDDILVVYDDMDIAFGKIKLKPKGSAGGHNGLKSLIQAFGRSDFARLRIGIDRPQDKDVVKYVLSNFSKEEQRKLPELLDCAFAAIELWLSNQPRDKVMSIINSA